MKETENPHFETEEVTVIDEVCFWLKAFIFSFFQQECGISYCPICKLDKKVRHIKVRGLCEKSMYNSVYILTLNQDGNVIYLGQYTSSIVFNKTEQVWQWFDQKDSKSVAIR